MDIGILGYVLIIFITIIIVKLYQDSDTFNLKCIVSNVDGNTYCVRERSKLQLAADKLAHVTQNLKKLVEYLNKKHTDKEEIKRLVKGFNPKKVVETLPTSQYTAYSENKGEKLAFCLDSEKNGGNLIDENTLMFVALHEISHIATKSVGHTDEFWTNFKFILQEAEEFGIYKPEDYKKKPKKYCGMKITDNPYYDY
jgi:hypothetical protein